MKITSSKKLVQNVLPHIDTIDSREVKKRLKENNSVLIDIRDIRELWREGTIMGSKHVPRCMLEFWLDPESSYFKKDISIEKNLILFCAQGMRSALATKTLKDMGFENVCHVQGGFEKLKEFGFEIQEVKKK
ncbi:MAG: rhodanese-like domain-containing protein [Candidatus Fonsibacter sp.]